MTPSFAVGSASVTFANQVSNCDAGAPQPEDDNRGLFRGHVDADRVHPTAFGQQRSASDFVVGGDVSVGSSSSKGAEDGSAAAAPGRCNSGLERPPEDSARRGPLPTTASSATATAATTATNVKELAVQNKSVHKVACCRAQAQNVRSNLDQVGSDQNMQQAAATDLYFRPYSLHNPHPAASSNPSAVSAAAAAAAAQQYSSLYPLSAAAMSPNMHHKITSSSPMDQGDPRAPTTPMIGSFSINNITNPQQDQMQVTSSHYSSFSHHPGLYTGSYSPFDYGVSPTTHIPLDPYQQHPPPQSQQQQQQQQQQQPHQAQRIGSFPARPQPTRPVPGAAPTGPGMPLAASDNGNTICKMETDSVNPRSQPPSSSLNDKLNNNSTSSGNGNGNNSGNGNGTSNSNNCNTKNNNLSPQGPALASPASSGQQLSPGSSQNKFRYPSGPSNNSVQSLGSATSPHVIDRGPATPSSALSSREGTPLPAGKVEDPAPNVDISRVQIKEMSHGYSDFSPPPPPPPSVAAAAQMRGSSYLQHMRPRGAQAGYPGFYPTSQMGMEGIDSHHMQQSITLSQRGVGGGREPGSSASSHGTVKIGRRPAHLPKVLKENDPTLPPGWTRKLKQRKHGKQAGRWDVYIYSPCGVKFASRKKLRSFFEKNNLNYDPEDFDFTPYGRHIDNRTSAPGPSGMSGSGHPSGGSGSSASRHNSSGSTGSDGTHPGSNSPASITNYSPSQSIPYVPNSLTIGVHSSMASCPPSVATSVCSTSSFAEFNSFAHFDTNMPGPPNACATDVSGSGPADSFCLLGSSPSLSFQHLGRGHHHPISVNKEHAGAGSEFFPSAEMAEILGGSSGEPTHNGFVPFSNVASSDLNRGLQPLSNVSASSRTSEDESSLHKQSGIKTSTTASISTHGPLSSSSSSTTTTTTSASAMDSLVGDRGSSSGSFSLGRTMISVLQESQDGFDYFPTDSY